MPVNSPSLEIKALHARQIIDSRGNPTVEVEVLLLDGVRGMAAVPSGASTGVHEALELRDGEVGRYRGKGVLKAVRNVNDVLATRLVGHSWSGQSEIDDALVALDGTVDKSSLGANALLGVSLAVARAAANREGMPLYRYLGGPEAHLLPVPFFNVLNGGKHAEGSLDFQEFMVVPVSAGEFADALRMGSEVYHSLGRLLAETGLPTTVGDEGGFAPRLSRNEDALALIVKAVEMAGYRPGHDMSVALDPAVSELYENGRYVLAREHLTLEAEEMIDLWEDWCGRYPIISIEDGMAQDDWNGWSLLTARLGRKVQLVGDDLFVTNVDRIRRGQEERAANAVLIKPNQIGTLSETLAAMEAARSGSFACLMSHRSGETEDTAIADLAVATGCGQIKAGAPCRGERVAKYNRLIRIEEQLGVAGRLAGPDIFTRRGVS